MAPTKACLDRYERGFTLVDVMIDDKHGGLAFGVGVEENEIGPSEEASLEDALVRALDGIYQLRVEIRTGQTYSVVDRLRKMGLYWLRAKGLKLLPKSGRPKKR